jgi:hypothetical protein
MHWPVPSLAPEQPEDLRLRVAELETEVAQLRRGLESRTVISAAIGMLMLAMPTSESTAFKVLSYISQTTNTKMRTLAEAMCAHVADGRGLPPDVSDLLRQVMDTPRTALTPPDRRLRVVPDD